MSFLILFRSRRTEPTKLQYSWEGSFLRLQWKFAQLGRRIGRRIAVVCGFFCNAFWSARSQRESNTTGIFFSSNPISRGFVSSVSRQSSHFLTFCIKESQLFFGSHQLHSSPLPLGSREDIDSIYRNRYLSVI